MRLANLFKPDDHGVIPDWTVEKAAKYERAHLEREGLAGFHHVAPKRWEPRPLKVEEVK